jgi:hypothetical protein
MDEVGLPVLSLRTLTHSNQGISEDLRGVVQGHAGGQQFVRTVQNKYENNNKNKSTPENRRNTGKTGQ